jgi:hypothetical protein
MHPSFDLGFTTLPAYFTPMLGCELASAALWTPSQQRFGRSEFALRARQLPSPSNNQ